MGDYWRGLILSIVDKVCGLHWETVPAHRLNDTTQNIKPDALHLVSNDPLKLNTAQPDLFSQRRNRRHTMTLYSQISQVALEFNNHSSHTPLYHQVILWSNSINFRIIKMIVSYKNTIVNLKNL